MYPLLQVELFPEVYEYDVTIGPGHSTWIRVSLSSSLISPLVGPSDVYIKLFDSDDTSNVDFYNNFKSIAYDFSLMFIRVANNAI